MIQSAENHKTVYFVDIMHTTHDTTVVNRGHHMLEIDVQ